MEKTTAFPPAERGDENRGPTSTLGTVRTGARGGGGLSSGAPRRVPTAPSGKSATGRAGRYVEQDAGRN